MVPIPPRLRNLPSSRLRLEAHWLESLRYYANPEFDLVDRAREPRIRFSAECAPDPDNGSYTIRIHVRSPRRRGGNVPYTFEITLGGNFSLVGADDPVSESDRRILRFNGPAILYGIARGLLCAATATAVYGPVSLPSGNLAAVLLEDD